MAMKTLKSWKSTRECRARVAEMGNRMRNLYLTIKQDDDEKKWWWEISIIPSWSQHDVIIEDVQRHYYQDDAANEGYRFAHRYLRPKRRKKKKT